MADRINIQSAFVALLTVVMAVMTSGCLKSLTIHAADPVDLPLMRNTASQCYYIDEFLPLPNNVLTGRSGEYALRHYFYKKANYKEWGELPVMLSFYSKDGRCWSLYEEYTAAQ